MAMGGDTEGHARGRSLIAAHSQLLLAFRFMSPDAGGGTIRQVKLRGRNKVSDVFTLAMLAVNLRRLPSLLAAQTAMAGSG